MDEIRSCCAQIARHRWTSPDINGMCYLRAREHPHSEVCGVGLVYGGWAITAGSGSIAFNDASLRNPGCTYSHYISLFQEERYPTADVAKVAAMFIYG